tara:strand:+ start:461 stop:658 length:198 start_codon:yes stop_codon:yes gene_type:complete
LDQHLNLFIKLTIQTQVLLHQDYLLVVVEVIQEIQDHLSQVDQVVVETQVVEHQVLQETVKQEQE